VHGLDVPRARAQIELLAAYDVLLHVREHGEGPRDPVCRGVDQGECLEGERGRIISGEHGGRIACALRSVMACEHHVHRGATAAKIVAIHPVVMDEQIRLQKLEGGARPDRDVLGGTGIDRQIGGHQQRGAQPLAASHGEVAHGADHGDDVGAERLAGGELGLEQRAEACVDGAAHAVEQHQERIGTGPPIVVCRCAGGSRHVGWWAHEGEGKRRAPPLARQSAQCGFPV
jgi:hypothetical protein